MTDRDLFPFTDFSCVLSALQLEVATIVFEKLVVSHCSNHFSEQLLQAPFYSLFHFFVESHWQGNTV